jgi:predicted transposase/invertase (TIGR01784 family)
MAFEHDRRYKKLFSHPYFVQKLLESFVYEDFIRELDFKTLKRVDKSFVTEDFREKESDIIYSINFREKSIYIFLLLEFQSSVDKNMALRFPAYVLDLYASLHKRADSGLFPAVFPVLLYNGDQKWTAEKELGKLIEQTIPKRYIPRFEYYAIIENEIPKESLKRIKNAVSAVFYIENLDENRLKEEIDTIVEIIRDEELEITKQFADFFNNFLENKTELLDREYLGHKIEDAMEVKTMLTTTLQNIREKGIQEGRQEGRQEGIQEGRQEGKVEVVLSMDKNGVPVDKIALYTSLTEEKIREILKEQKG